MFNIFYIICHYRPGWCIKDFFDALTGNSPQHRMNEATLEAFLRVEMAHDDPERKVDVWTIDELGFKHHIIVKGEQIYKYIG